jgi:hypothetical protein
VGGPLRSPSHVASLSAGVANLGSVVDGSLRPLRSAPTGSLLLVDIEVKPSPGKQLLKQPP